MVRTLLLAALLGGTVAHAQTAADGEAKAKELFAKGNQLLEEGDTRGALAMYQSAYAHFPNPKLLLNIGTLLRRLGRNAEAADTYERYLSVEGFDAQRAPEVAQALADIEPLVGRLRIEAPPGSRVTVDEKDVGVVNEPKAVRVDPGSHTVNASQEGYQPGSVSVTVAAGEEVPVPIALEESQRAPVVGSPRTARWPESGADTDAEARYEFEPDEEPAPLSHAWHVGLSARSETDVKSGGTGSAFGATLGLGRYLEASAMGLIQRDTGLRIAAAIWLVPDGHWKPFVRVGAPMFFGDGATTTGVHAGAGLVWDITELYGLTLDMAVEHFPGAPDLRDPTAIVLGAGLHVRVF